MQLQYCLVTVVVEIIILNHKKYIKLVSILYIAAIEYSDESMMRAVKIHSSWSSFLKSADAYVRGQLICKPINEPQLMHK